MKRRVTLEIYSVYSKAFSSNYHERDNFHRRGLKIDANSENQSAH